MTQELANRYLHRIADIEPPYSPKCSPASKPFESISAKASAHDDCVSVSSRAIDD